MAPRRGGGGGSIFSSSDGGDGDSSVWTEKTLLFGTHFHNHYRLAYVVVEAILLFALIVVAVGSLTFKKRSQSSHSIFRWFNFGLAMIMALV